MITFLFVWTFNVNDEFIIPLFAKYRVTKENRAAGVLDNFAEGEKYAEHALRKYVRNKAPEIMPSINNFFTDPKYWYIDDYDCLETISMIEIAFFCLWFEHKTYKDRIHK